ncbi:hypothetical protein L227DRAFT_97894 [Lentinus tigrinus ALCF2SS1-6]|uniref:Gfd2/YDR514C-like C-terminal domain-containing protein n=2 Tax=Lentinus tigrinus TaxID=5365 RepID=A0A5C2S9B2_9APHY|nr:hypothetical protein L227DRAFT_97894 [Lentinus tigrinus ALCF2SS1-6]
MTFAFHKLECSMLSVPIDWRDPASGSTEILILRSLARHWHREKRRGTIFFAPDADPETGIVDPLLPSGADEQPLPSQRICRHFSIETSYLRNAGNDACYTLDAMISTASGDSVDQQRKPRWPNCTTDNMLQIDFQEREEDPDFSDKERISPTATSSLAHIRIQLVIIYSPRHA